MELRILTAVLMVIIAGLFAGAETGVYQLSRLRLRMGIENKQLLFIVTGKLMQDSPGLLLSMLLGTNLAHYIATCIVTYMFLAGVHTEHTAELFATLSTAPVLFVFSELIPKNIFFYRADSLIPYLSPVLYASHKLFSWCGAVPLLKAISDIFTRLTRSSVSSKTIITAVQRYHVRSIFQDTQEEGILSPVQLNIVNRLVTISHIRVRSIMTPVNQVQMVDVKSDISALLSRLKEHEFTRLPVYDSRPDNIIGFINIYEALGSRTSFTDLRKYLKPISKLRADTMVDAAMNFMRAENQKIVLIIRVSRTGRERPIGIVTMKDLAEELLGELVKW